MLQFSSADLMYIEKMLPSSATLRIGLANVNVSNGLRFEVSVPREGFTWYRTFTEYELIHIIDKFYVLESVGRQAMHEYTAFKESRKALKN